MIISTLLPLRGDTSARRSVSEINDDREVFRVMSEHLNDFDQYMSAIGQFIKTEL